MSTGKSILFNTSIQLVGRFISAGLSFFTLLLLAQSLGVFYYGEYTKVTTYIMFFYMIVDFGINAIYLRETENKAPDDFPKLLGLRIAIGSFLTLVAIILMLILKTIYPSGFTNLVFLSLIIGAWSIVFNGIAISAAVVFQHQRRFDRSVISQVIASLVTVILLILFYRQIKNDASYGVLISTSILLFSSLIFSIISLLYLKLNQVSVFPKIDIKFWKKILLLSIPFGLTLIFNVVYFRIDTFILTVYRSSSEIGAYGLAYKFFEFALVIPAFLMNSIYPDLLEKKDDQIFFWKNTQQIFKGLFFLSLLIIIVVWFLAPLLTMIKADFQSSIKLLRILILSLPLFYLTSPLMWFFIILKQQKKLVIIYGLSMVLNIILNLFLIPIIGAEGAAITTGITEFFVLFFGIIILRRIKYAT